MSSTKNVTVPKPAPPEADSMKIGVDTEELSAKEPLVRLARDLRDASNELTRQDARWLVDMYYVVQEDRKRAKAQQRTSGKAKEPCRLVSWMFRSFNRFEAALQTSLKNFAETYSVGRWMMSQYGIGPVISSGCLVYFDIKKAPTVGHFWRFAGLDPTLKWLGKANAPKLLKEIGLTTDAPIIHPNQIIEINKASGQHTTAVKRAFDQGFSINQATPSRGYKGVLNLLSVRPWNAKLKSLVVFRMGECFVKFSGRSECFYGQLWLQKKQSLWIQNLDGEFSGQAEQDFDGEKFDKTTTSINWIRGDYTVKEVQHWLKSLSDAANMGTAAERKSAREAVGMTPKRGGEKGSGIKLLPPAQVHARARRWTVKLFLSHLHHVMYVDAFGKSPPAPYIFDHPSGEDHRHLIDPPNYQEDEWPGDHAGRTIDKLVAS